MSRFDESMYILNGRIYFYYKKILSRSDQKFDENLIQTKAHKVVNIGDYVLNNKLDQRYASLIYKEIDNGTSETIDTSDVLIWALRVALAEFPDQANFYITEEVMAINGTGGGKGTIQLKPYMYWTEENGDRSLTPLTFRTTGSSTRTIGMSDFALYYYTLPSLESLGDMIDGFGKAMLTLFSKGAGTALKSTSLVKVGVKKLKRPFLKLLLKKLGKPTTLAAIVTTKVTAEITKKLVANPDLNKLTPVVFSNMIRQSVSETLAGELTDYILKPLKNQDLFAGIKDQFKKELSNYLLKLFVAQIFMGAAEISLSVILGVPTDFWRDTVPSRKSRKPSATETDIKKAINKASLPDLLKKVSEDLIQKIWDKPPV
jgi:hypothetical protein